MAEGTTSAATVMACTVNRAITIKFNERPDTVGNVADWSLDCRLLPPELTVWLQASNYADSLPHVGPHLVHCW